MGDHKENSGSSSSTDKTAPRITDRTYLGKRKIGGQEIDAFEYTSWGGEKNPFGSCSSMTECPNPTYRIDLPEARRKTAREIARDLSNEMISLQKTWESPANTLELRLNALKYAAQNLQKARDEGLTKHLPKELRNTDYLRNRASMLIDELIINARNKPAVEQYMDLYTIGLFTGTATKTGLIPRGADLSHLGVNMAYFNSTRLDAAEKVITQISNGEEIKILGGAKQYVFDDLIKELKQAHPHRADEFDAIKKYLPEKPQDQSPSPGMVINPVKP